MKYITQLMGEIMEGNVVGDLQRSNYIRPATETQCNGMTRPEGDLRKFDLDTFKSFYTIPQSILAAIDSRPDQTTCLYAFKKPSRSSSSNKTWAWLLTDEYHQPIMHLVMPGFRNTDHDMSMILDWFNVHRLENYVNGWMARQLQNYIQNLREKGNGIKPSNFRVQAIQTHAKPAADFESITVSTPSDAIKVSRKVILNDPSLKGRIEIIGSITDKEWKSLPSDERHILFPLAPQAQAERQSTYNF